MKKSYTMFQMSSPGYYFDEVEEQCNKYIEAIKDLDKANDILQSELSEKDAELQTLRATILSLQEQLNCMEVPTMNKQSEIELIQSFSNQDKETPKRSVVVSDDRDPTEKIETLSPQRRKRSVVF